jgi:hypothetical protein
MKGAAHQNICSYNAAQSFAGAAHRNIRLKILLMEEILRCAAPVGFGYF